MITTALLLSLALPPQGPSAITLLEDFDEPGTSWTETLFSEEHTAPGNPFTRESLAGVLGAPDTFPPLPINAGGDLDGRLTEISGISGSGFALTADVPQNQYEDVAVRGYVGSAPLFGGPNVGFLVRASINPNPAFGSGLNAYTAILQTNATLPTATLLLGRWRDGVVTVADVFATATFPADLAHENYRIELRAQGELVSARLWRVHVVAGSVVTEPVAFSTGPGPSNLLWARDSELTSGRVGVYGFARSGSSVFWDDVQIGQPPDKLRGFTMAPGF